MWHKKEGAVFIRPHHGMCLAFFEGKGYSEGFSGHMQETLTELEKNVPVVLSVRTDEICSACPNCEDGACEAGDQVKEYDLAVLELCGLQEGEALMFTDFARMVQDHILSAGYREAICGNCQWDVICRNRTSRWYSLGE